MLESLNWTPQGALVSDEVLKASFKIWWPELEAVLAEARGRLVP
jgi:hypothetical protein